MVVPLVLSLVQVIRVFKGAQGNKRKGGWENKRKGGWERVRRGRDSLENEL